MADWGTHILTFIGPKRDIDRFAVEFQIVAGAVDPVTDEILDGWETKPRMNLGRGRYFVEKCWRGVCDIEVQCEAVYFDSPEVRLYRHWAEKYPTLRIVWRYYLGDFGAGYVDECGDHRWSEEEETWVEECRDE